MPELSMHPIRTQEVRQFSAEEIERIVGLYGFVPAKGELISQLHAFADATIEGEIAPEFVLRHVEASTSRSLHLRFSKGRPDAFLAHIPLTESGKQALLQGSFGFSDSHPDWLSAPGARPEAVLIWGMSGASARGKAAAAHALIHTWNAVYHDIPAYSRARSMLGRGFMERVNMHPVPEAPKGDTLLVSTEVPEKFRSLGLVPPARAGEGEAA